MRRAPFILTLPSSWWSGAPYPPRRWQLEALPLALRALEAGRKGLVHAVTGAGKSALVAEICHSVLLGSWAKIVISVPTQDLVRQLAEDLERRLLVRVGQWYGRAKNLRPHVVIACNPSLPTLAEALTANGFRTAIWIVDEAHNSECATLLEAAQALAPYALLGLTATPFRTNPNESLSLFEELIYSYPLDAAMRDKVLVPIEVRPWTGPEDISLDDACVHMIREALAEGLRPGAVDAGGVDASGEVMGGCADADRFAARLRQEGIRALAIHSNQPDRANAATLAALKRGDLDVIVHVDKLKEGVNLPCLRFGVFRRKRGSRNDFIQHAGRYVRTAPGKTKAVLYDPHDLFGALRLSYEAAIGGDLDDALEEARDRAPSRPCPQPGAHCAQVIHMRPRSIDEATFYLRRVRAALETASVLRRHAAQGDWRHDPAKDAQLAVLQRAGDRCGVGKLASLGVPAEVVAGLKACWRRAHARQLNMGAVCDLTDILTALPAVPWPRIATELLTSGRDGLGLRRQEGAA